MNHHGVLAANSNINIPLHCNICPKQPDFSDVSHLLTHIASKGHLSHYYKVKVKAGTDAGSKLLIDEYDQWYDDWNVQDLMMERMSQKERKKGGGNGGGSSRRSSAGLASRNLPVTTTLAARRMLRESTLDPQLGVKIKKEPKSRSATPMSALAFDPAVLNRSYAPPMQSWPATPYNHSPVSYQPSLPYSFDSTPSSESPDMGQPRRGRPKKPRKESASIQDYTEFDEKSKLKGVILPGMGCFDSATAEGQRKRNQKKHESVLQSLIDTSEVVQPTEQVFDAKVELQRERLITGKLESDDDELGPLPGESSPEPDHRPPVRKRRPGRPSRYVLEDEDINTRRANRLPRRRAQPHHGTLRNGKRSGLSNGNRSMSMPYFQVPDEDDEVTFEGFRPSNSFPGRRTGLSIHCDNSGPEITFNNPASMRTLSMQFPNPLQDPQSQTTHQNGSHLHNHQPSFLGGSAAFRAAGNNPLFPLTSSMNFGSFGQLSHHSMLPNAGFHGTNPFQFNGPQPIGPAHRVAPPERIVPSQPFPFGNENGFGAQNGQVHNQSQNDYDQKHAQNQKGSQLIGPSQPFAFGNENVFQDQSSHGRNQSQNGHGHSHAQSLSAWDPFGAWGPPDMGIEDSNTDVGGQYANTGFSPVNPLFFSSTRGAPEDDEATVSPPHSERKV